MKKLNSYVSGLFLALASVAAHAGNTTAERPYKSSQNCFQQTCGKSRISPLLVEGGSDRTLERAV